jgi:hypothetical protein
VYARIGGVLYLIIIVIGLFCETFVRDRLIVSGDATATANNIMASQLLWRIGISAELVMLACAIALAMIFYVLLRPVSRNLALLAVFFNLVSIALEAADMLNLFAALFLVKGAEYLKTFEPSQRQTLAYLFLKLHGYGYAVSLVFFGFFCLFIGYLIFKASYFPKTLGVLMIGVFLSYLIDGFALFLAPKLAAMIFPAILVPAFIGELSLCLWLLVKGVNLSKWEEGRGQV